MRQIGMLAAAADYALDHNVARLEEDHRHAKSLASAIHSVVPTAVNPEDVDTNIVVLDLNGASASAAQINAQLKEAGILTSALGPTTLRLVTHLDVSADQIAQVNEVLPGLVQRAFKS
jgi:threonine aldolase